MITHKTKQLHDNKEKELNSIDFPFKVKHRLGPIKIPGEGTPKNERQKFKEPIALIIKSNYEVMIKENVKEGYITLMKKVGNNEEEIRIFNPKSKLLSFPIGGTVYRGWILDENEAVALPTDIHHDSLVLKRIMEALMLNYEEFKTKQMKVWMKYALYILLAIIGGTLIMGIMGFNIWDIFGNDTAVQGTTQTINYIIDANAITAGGTI